MPSNHLTPRQIVEKLDQYIIGQGDAKRAVAIARILMPKIHLPATTSLGVIDQGERNDVFSCGANVIMRKVTPSGYKELYKIYPSNQTETDIFTERKELEKLIFEMGRRCV